VTPEADICPKCGATMEFLVPDDAAPSRLRICPNCSLLAWDENGQVRTLEPHQIQ